MHGNSIFDMHINSYAQQLYKASMFHTYVTLIQTVNRLPSIADKCSFGTFVIGEKKCISRTVLRVSTLVLCLVYVKQTCVHSNSLPHRIQLAVSDSGPTSDALQMTINGGRLSQFQYIFTCRSLMSAADSRFRILTGRSRRGMQLFSLTSKP